MTNEKVMAKGLCDRIGIPGGNFKHTVPEKDLTYKKEIQIENHSHAIRLIVDALVNKEPSLLLFNMIGLYYRIACFSRNFQ